MSAVVEKNEKDGDKQRGSTYRFKESDGGEFAVVLDLANKESGDSEQSDVTARDEKLSSSEGRLTQKKGGDDAGLFDEEFVTRGRCRERGTRRVL